MEVVYVDELDVLVRKIYDIIPAYYDKKEAEEIKKLILAYIENRKNKENSTD